MDRVVHHELRERALRWWADRDDVEPFNLEGLVRGLAQKRMPGPVVAIRGPGREAILYCESGSPSLAPLLYQYEIVPKWGSLEYGEVIVDDVDLEAWLQEHRDELGWVHPEWREE